MPARPHDMHMNRRSFLALGLGVGGSIALGGCLSGDSSDAEPTSDGQTDAPPVDQPTTPSPVADVGLASIGQDEDAEAQQVEVTAVVKNRGDQLATDVEVTVALLDGGEVAMSQTLQLGDLAPDETASFALSFDVDPATVDGRRITFD